MSLYSYKGAEPTDLPFRIKLENGETRTSLHELTDQELVELGFVGPIIYPTFDGMIQKIEWNGQSYDVIDMTQEEIDETAARKEIKKLNLRRSNVDYNNFWNLFSESATYKKLRIYASQNLSANTLCTELISLFNDAKSGNANEGLIQKYIDILFFSFEFTPEEIAELQSIFVSTNLDAFYSFPDENYLQSHMYHAETNNIIPNPPFNSWIYNGKMWVAPVPYPSDGNVYTWDEPSLSWVSA